MRRSWRVGVSAGGPPCDEFSVAFLSDAIWASHRVAAFAARCGLSQRARAELAIVASELVTNAVKFAGGGTVRIEQVLAPHEGICLIVEDDGPGIDEPESAVLDGYSEGRMWTPEMDMRGRRGLGSGLAAAKRLSDALSVQSSESGGARLVVHKWRATR